jgi:single-strand DNA-binding protein
MIGINRVTLLGRVAAQPEIKETQSGKSMVRLAVCIPGRKKDDGEQDVEYFDVTAWDGTADACAKFVTKGMPIYIEGRLKKRVWTAEDGTKRSKYTVNAKRIVFLGSKGGGSSDEPVLPAGAEPIPEEVER